MLDSIFNASYTKDDLTDFRLMLKSTVCSGLSNKELAALSEVKHLRTYKRNEVVFFRNDPAQAFYLIKSGQVQLDIDFDENFEIIATLAKGKSFGENALFDKSRRRCTAKVISETAEIYMFAEMSVMEILHRNAALKAKIFSNLLKEANEFQDRLFDIYRQSHGFFELKQIYGA